MAPALFVFLGPSRADRRLGFGCAGNNLPEQRIREFTRSARSAAVLGGGLLGLEAARALHHLGLTTHVVEMAPPY